MSLLYFMEFSIVQVTALMLREITLWLPNNDSAGKDPPDSNLTFRLFLLQIPEADNVQNRILAQMDSQIAATPQYVGSIPPPFPSIPRKPRANGHPCP